MTVYLVISLPKILCIHCIYIILANPAYLLHPKTNTEMPSPCTCVPKLCAVCRLRALHPLHTHTHTVCQVVTGTLTAPCTYFLTHVSPHNLKTQSAKALYVLLALIHAPVPSPLHVQLGQEARATLAAPTPPPPRWPTQLLSPQPVSPSPTRPPSKRFQARPGRLESLTGRLSRCLHLSQLLPPLLLLHLSSPPRLPSPLPLPKQRLPHEVSAFFSACSLVSVVVP
jgi:hypothetical protein